MSDFLGPETALATEFVDLDGDGHLETTLVDSDSDGYVDTALTDVDGDGYDDVAAFDNSPDEAFVPDVVAIDHTGDGVADVILDDTDLDGTFDDVTTGPGTVLADSNPYGGTWGQSWSGSSGDDVFEVPSS